MCSFHKWYDEWWGVTAPVDNCSISWQWNELWTENKKTPSKRFYRLIRRKNGTEQTSRRSVKWLLSAQYRFDGYSNLWILWKQLTELDFGSVSLFLWVGFNFQIFLNDILYDFHIILLVYSNLPLSHMNSIYCWNEGEFLFVFLFQFKKCITFVKGSWKISKIFSWPFDKWRYAPKIPSRYQSNQLTIFRSINELNF